jgi:hypothetical protein
MKCFRHSSRHTAVSELGERAADPETIPGSPIEPTKARAQTRCPSPPQSVEGVASEEMSGAEMVHTYVATMRPEGGATTAPLLPRAIAAWSDASLFGRVAGCRGLAGVAVTRPAGGGARPRTHASVRPPEVTFPRRPCRHMAYHDLASGIGMA